VLHPDFEKKAPKGVEVRSTVSFLLLFAKRLPAKLQFATCCTTMTTAKTLERSG